MAKRQLVGTTAVVRELANSLLYLVDFVLSFTNEKNKKNAHNLLFIKWSDPIKTKFTTSKTVFRKDEEEEEQEEEVGEHCFIRNQTLAHSGVLKRLISDVGETNIHVVCWSTWL